MKKATCSVDGCEREVRCRALCNMHYERQRAHGETGSAETLHPGTFGTCVVEDCDWETRSSGSPYCELHYGRIRRTGTLNAKRPWNRRLGICSVDGCDRPAQGSGMCGMHAARVKVHGDPSVVTRQIDRNLPRGEANHKWTGDQASYDAIHQRVKSVMGPAKEHPCVECGAPARHWSYDNADPDERTEGDLKYSTSISHYVPRCVPCHKRFDLLVRPPRRAPVDHDEIRRLHAQGVRVLAMSKLLGVGRKRIDYALDELGLPHFKPGSPDGRSAA